MTVQELLNKLDCSQEELARRIQCSVNTIRRYRKENVDIEKLKNKPVFIKNALLELANR